MSTTLQPGRRGGKLGRSATNTWRISLRTFPKEGAPSGITPTDAMLGQFFYVVAHEMGHAMFDALNVPLFGRPEDAADGFAAFLMLHLGTKEDARLSSKAPLSATRTT